MVLLGEVFHSCGKGLYLSFEGSSTWFVSLIVGGSHRESEYHTTLCSGSGSITPTTMKLLLCLPQTVPTNDAKNRQ